MSLRCEDVRELLPEYAEAGLRTVGELEEHLAGCAGCSRELATYREIVASLGALAAVELEPRPELLGAAIRTVRVAAVTDRLPALREVRTGSARVAAALRGSRKLALASLGGLAVGVTAIGLVWWRVARRAVEGAPAAA